MSTQGIEGIYVETQNWGRTVAFWQALGFELVFETDHHSGQLRHPDGGPYLFVAERPDADELTMQPILRVADSTTFDPPAGAPVREPFTPRHWQVVEMLLEDPDQRPISLQAPLPAGVEAPPGH